MLQNDLLNTKKRKDQEYVLKTAEALRHCTDIQKAFLEGYVKGLEMAQDKKAS